jgi:integrase
LHLKQLDPFIGDLDIRNVHIGTLGRFIEARRKTGIKSKSINLALGVARHILNVAAVTDARKPYPLSWEEQTRLFKELPDRLARMALFKVNTGCREQEVCGLRWEWEIEVPELDTSVFLIPAEKVKNGDERLVVLNSDAKSVIESLRGQHPEYVFTYQGQRQKKMNNSSWRKARARAGLSQVRIHDLKHTFGRRLRAAGVSLEDRQDLLGHRSGRITSHYSAAELTSLIEAANKVVGQGSRKSPALVVLKKKAATALAVTA